MALFTRRVLQACLDENAGFVSTIRLGDWVARLNKVSNDYVATEWEIVLLRAFARVGNVLHEPPLGGRPLDLVFGSSDGRLNFAADIVAISDQPLHEKNPIECFQDELSRRIRKAKILSGRFVFRVEEDQPIAHRGTGRKRRLSLPSVNEFEKYIFNVEFDKYIEAIRQEPQQSRAHHIHNLRPLVALSIHYQPGIGSGVSSASYGTYTSTTVKDDNPLFNALKSKAAQLKQGGYEGIRGIIVCDRGSRIFTEMHNWSTFTVDEVIKEFFRQNKSVAFVWTMWTRSRALNYGGQFHPDLDLRLFVRETVAKEEWAAELDRLAVQITRSLPRIELTPENAVNRLKWNRSTVQTKPYLGGWTLKGNEIRISARELLDLLSGKLDHKRFAQHHIAGSGNIFSLYQAQGKIIKRAEVEHCPDEDDDYLVLEFGADDPAVSPFKVPKKAKPE